MNILYIIFGIVSIFAIYEIVMYLWAVKKLKGLIKRIFPKKIYDEWFAYQAYQKHRGKEQLPEYFGKDGKYIDYKCGDIVPLKVEGKFKAFYKIVKIRRPHGDYAMWDDGRKYDLVFHHIEKIKEKV